MDDYHLTFPEKILALGWGEGCLFGKKSHFQTQQQQDRDR